MNWIGSFSSTRVDLLIVMIASREGRADTDQTAYAVQRISTKKSWFVFLKLQYIFTTSCKGDEEVNALNYSCNYTRSVSIGLLYCIKYIAVTTIYIVLKTLLP